MTGASGLTQPRRILGVDAGGTGTRAVVVEGGQVVEVIDIGSMNVVLHADSATRLAALIRRTRVDAAGLGLAGVQSETDARRVVQDLRALTDVPVAVTDDSEVALIGAFAGQPGIVVIAGTGSIACGRDESGAFLRIGGHGFLLGDEGGGYWIGREVLRAALGARDGSAAPTALSGLVRSALGSDLHEVVRRVHAAPTDRSLLAGLVPAAAALEGDPVAADIFVRAAAALGELAATLRSRLGPLPVAMVGGVFQIAAVRDAFVHATAAVVPAEPPQLGAVRFAEMTFSTKEMKRR